MIKTEKKYWVNGHQIRGGWYHTYARTIPLTPFAFMVCWGNGLFEIHTYKLCPSKSTPTTT